MRPGADLARASTILFDFDYTLVDSSDAVVECFNTALRGIGAPAAAPAAIRRTIGLSIEASLVQVAGEEHRPRLEAFRDHWRRRSDEIMTAWTRPLDGAAEAIREMRSGGRRLGIVSTKYRRRILETLARDGMEKYFEVVVGGEDVARHKPDPEGLLSALETLAAKPESALYVGDAPSDAEAARRAGITFAAVLTGVTRAEEFLDAGAEMIVADLSELAVRLGRREGA